jgi:hypothetical protein
VRDLVGENYHVLVKSGFEFDFVGIDKKSLWEVALWQRGTGERDQKMQMRKRLQERLCRPENAKMTDRRCLDNYAGGS